MKLRFSLHNYFFFLQFSMNTTRAEEITMREDYGNINLDSGGDDGFGDVPGMEVDGEESHTELRGVSGNLTVDQVNIKYKINNK
jgi:hypothetical protein